MPIPSGVVNQAKHRDRELSRRKFLPLLGVFAVASLAAPLLPAPASGQSALLRPRSIARFVYVGTYTAPTVPPGGSTPSVAEGIYVYRMDARTGNLALVEVAGVNNPSSLAFNAATNTLYSASEEEFGSFTHFAIHPRRGTLSALGSQTAQGGWPTHLSVHPSGQFLMLANYGGGNFPIYRLDANGNPLGLSDAFQSTGNGTGANPADQDAAHAHQIIADPAGLHVFGVDLAGDKVNVLNLDFESGRLTPNDVPLVTVPSGSGPRHMAFHPTAPHAYVLNELVSTISVFKYDAERGAMIWSQNVSTLPARFTDANAAAEIRVHPNGRFLYSTNRGHNSIAMFAIDLATGKLESIGFQSTAGEWPRGMNIDPSGTFLYAANQNTNTIAVFRVQANGRLQQTALVATPTPVDIVFGALVPR